MIEHRSMIAHLSSIKSKLGLPEICCLSFTNYVFDIFGLEYGLPLFFGGKVILSSIEHCRDDVSKYLDINLIQQTPSFYLNLISQIDNNIAKNIVCLTGGEVLSYRVCNILTEKFKKVYNVYGPTETTIWSTSAEMLGNQDGQPIHIGKVHENEKAYILDQTLIPVPYGVIGELYLAGAGVARGYLNRPELTTERFISNPFVSAEDLENGYTRLYKTGDLVRRLPDGNIEYIGRNDFQVKIRGFRIELGEIENALSSIDGIRQSVIIAKRASN